jgi:hypothetical protein
MFLSGPDGSKVAGGRAGAWQHAESHVSAAVSLHGRSFIWRDPYHTCTHDSLPAVSRGSPAIKKQCDEKQLGAMS